MIPEPDALDDFHPTDTIAATARPTPAFREELRRIPNTRNALAVASCWAQTIGIIAQTDTPTATLFACHPPHSAAYRYVVHLRLADA